MSEMATTRLNLEELPNNLREIKSKELREESGADVQARPHVFTPSDAPQVTLVLPDGVIETQWV